MKKVIFSCLFGGHDTLLNAPKFEGWDTILFTDEDQDCKGWDIRLVAPTGDPIRQSRYYKIMTHLHLPEYDLYCYMDANMKLVKSPPLFPIWGQHSMFRNVFQEANDVIRLRKATAIEVNRQMLFYKGSRIQGKNLITMNGFFVRRNNDKINEICRIWYEQIRNFSHRDQLGLPYVLEILKTEMENTVPYSIIANYFEIVNKHIKGVKSEPIAVHHITSGRADKNIGKAINDMVRCLPDEDWICLRDIDTIPMNHREFFRQCEVIAEMGEFDIVGCITNRVGLDYQLYRGEMSEDYDIKNHVKIGEELYNKYQNEVMKTDKDVAGLFMLFPKKIWSDVGGFDEGGIVNSDFHYHDYSFCQKVKRAKGRLGIARGIYLFHMYRMWEGHKTIHLY